MRLTSWPKNLVPAGQKSKSETDVRPKAKAFFASTLWSSLHSVRRQPLIWFANMQPPLLNSQSLRAASFLSTYHDDHHSWQRPRWCNGCVWQAVWPLVLMAMMAMALKAMALKAMGMMAMRGYHGNIVLSDQQSDQWSRLWLLPPSSPSASIGNGCVWPLLSDHVWPPLAAS